MIKYFKSNREYFDFLNKYKNKYNFLYVMPLISRVKVIYEKK